MSHTLFAGAARRVINPLLGTGKTGLRLFGDPIQAIESDLTATAVVVGNGNTKVVILAVDLCAMSTQEASEMRAGVAAALRIPAACVLLNLSHNHSSPALPAFMSMCGSPDEVALWERYQRDLARWLVEAATEAGGRLQPARVGTGWGESYIAVYRRESRGGQDVLGEVPGHPIDPSVGVIRIDDLDGRPIAILFRYSCHPVTVGGRSMVASTDFPGPARDVLEKCLGGLAVFLQGCGGNINPAVGIGYEIDCRDTKQRVGTALGGEALKVAAGIRTNLRPGPRKPLGNVPNILFTPWEPVTGDTCTYLNAVEQKVPLEFVALPSLEQAENIHAHWREELAERRRRNAQEWEVRVAMKYESWARILIDAVKRGHPTWDLHIQALRLNDIVIAGMNVETFFETGLEIKARSPVADTFVLGYTNGHAGYLPRGEDYPEGGWKLDGTYAVPDMLPQACRLPVIQRPDSADRAIDATLKLIERLVGN